MSLILDALRKMELERKAKRQSSQEIRAEVLHYRGTCAVPEKSRLIPVSAAVLLALAAAVGFFYPALDKSPEVKTLKITASGPLEQLPPAAALQKSPLPEIKPPQTAPAADAQTEGVIKKPTMEGITVSGIAWQEERYLRRAVINGSLVGEGAEIQGAKIVEIRENRVRFSRGGETFEVDHSSGAGR